MSRSSYRFMVFYIPAVLILAALTITTVNPFVFPTPQVGITRILPMFGFTVLLAGTAAGGLILHMMNEKSMVKPFVGVGLVFSLGIAITVSNVFRGPLLQVVAQRQGQRLAHHVARKTGKYTPVEYDARKDWGYIQYFLQSGQDRAVFRNAFCLSYKRTFRQHYNQYVETADLYQLGYKHGQKTAEARAGNARIRNEGSLAPPGEKNLQRLRLRRMPTYVDGFLEGYNHVRDIYPQ